MGQVYDFSPRKLYDIYRVKIHFREPVHGGFPKNRELIKAWVAAQTGYNDAQTEVQTAEHLAEVTESTAEKSWNGFKSDEHGLYLESRQVKALFKEAATMLRFTKNKRGSKDLLQHGFEVKSLEGTQRLHLGKKTPDGTVETPISVQTAQGPRQALKRSDYVEGVALEFEVWVLKTPPQDSRYLSEQDIVEMLTFAQEDGLGADRSQGMGKFNVEDFTVVQRVKVQAKKKEEDPGEEVEASKLS